MHLPSVLRNNFANNECPTRYFVYFFSFAYIFFSAAEVLDTIDLSCNSLAFMSFCVVMLHDNAGEAFAPAVYYVHQGETVPNNLRVGKEFCDLFLLRKEK
tara:strand:+ start:181 stop:480 length:300 start_codon:yes stop_codon:yes gene_type:complete